MDTHQTFQAFECLQWQVQYLEVIELPTYYGIKSLIDPNRNQHKA